MIKKMVVFIGLLACAGSVFATTLDDATLSDSLTGWYGTPTAELNTTDVLAGTYSLETTATSVDTMWLQRVLPAEGQFTQSTLESLEMHFKVIATDGDYACLIYLNSSTGGGIAASWAYWGPVGSAYWESGVTEAPFSWSQPDWVVDRIDIIVSYLDGTSTTIIADDYSISVVPEPMTMMLLGVGGGLVLFKRKHARG